MRLLLVFLCGFLLFQTRVRGSSSRVDALVNNMTLLEKIGQMTQLDITMVLQENSYWLNATAMEYMFSNWKVGSLLNSPFSGGIVDGKSGFNATEFVNMTNTLQQFAMQYAGIPIIFGLDSVHGANYVYGSVMFPHNLGVAATFNRTCAYEVGTVAGQNTRQAGVPWAFAPVTGIGVMPLWPRFYETFGEDPYLAGQMSANSIQGLQQNGDYANSTAACLKHFLGYPAPKSGKDRTTAWIGQHQIMRYFAPPFQDAVNAGVLSLMVNSGSIDGVPVHSSYEYLTTLLRNEMGFEGMACSDWQDLEKLNSYHAVADDYVTADAMGVLAGVDMSMVPDDYTFGENLMQLVQNGIISEDRINLSVKRILTLKEQVGILDNPYAPLPSASTFDADRQTALDVARQSIVLARNEGNVLPLSSTNASKIALIGPTASNISAQSGGWSIHWQGARSSEFTYGTTLLDALTTLAGAATVAYERGSNLNSSIPNGVKNAVSVASEADVTVLCLGEGAEAEEVGDINSLLIYPAQQQLYHEVCRVAKRLVVVMIGARPRIVPNVLACADAFIAGFLPGPDGGQAIAEIIMGVTNPSGKMPISYPQFSGDIGVPYWHAVSDITDPLFVFGTGLSYTTFEYSNLQLNATTISPGESISACVSVANTGIVDGSESILLEFASVKPEVKMLKKFEKVFLRAFSSGVETCLVLTEEDMQIIGRDMKRVVEDGNYTVSVGGLSASFTVQSANASLRAYLHRLYPDEAF